jgi:3-hydroxyisobutyrate dehydrogenase
MGSKQAHLLAKLPIDLAVYDTKIEAMQPFDGAARLAKDMADLACDADAVCLCVQDDAQVNSCADSLLPAMKAGSVLLVHATITPDTMVALGVRAAHFGIDVLDAPVTRTRMANDAPFLYCPVGGEQDVMDRVQPLLDSFATHTILAGPLGAGMALKICNNLVSWCEIVIGLEAVRLAQASGVSVDNLTVLMGENGVLTPPMKIFAQFATHTPTDRSFQNAMRNNAVVGEKDVRLAVELGRKAGIVLPMGQLIQSLVPPSLEELAERSEHASRQP